MPRVAVKRKEEPFLFPELNLKRDKAPSNSDVFGLTFRSSKTLPVHRWYPYVEGFSAPYIERLISEYAGSGIVFDPFGGSGTVNLIAAQQGVPSAFCEANPFMRFVAETKVNARHAALLDFETFEKRVGAFKRWATSEAFERASKKQDLESYNTAFKGRDFFNQKDIRELLTLRDASQRLPETKEFVDLFLLAVASVTVACSHMTRRADLRRRRDDEYVGRIVDVRQAVLQKLDQLVHDIQSSKRTRARLSFIAPDARHHEKKLRDRVSLLLTSPPYLNGTNYIRNTKLELWLLGFIKSEQELSGLNETCMVCGINNVVKGRPAEHSFAEVEIVASELDRHSPDARIPELVRGYFSDMLAIFKNCAAYLRSDGRMIFDIGDSRFYGIHVPTDTLLIEVARKAGLRLSESRVLARRHSRDKTPLRQVELTFVHA